MAKGGGRLEGMDTLERWLVRLPKVTHENVRFTFDDIMDFAATRVVLNGPIKTGTLRRAVHRGPIRGTLGRGYKTELEVRFKYALETHEHLPRL